jgi:hypothetical protein
VTRPQHGGRRLSRRRVLILVVAGVLLGTGGALFGTLHSNAASTSPTAHTAGGSSGGTTSTSGPSRSPSTSISASASPSAAASAKSSPVSSLSPAWRGACTSPSACGFPDAASTGPGSTKLTARSGNISIRTNGMVIKGWNLTGSLDVYADNVTVEDSRITSSNWWGVNLRPGHTGLRVLHSLITGNPGAGPDGGGEDYAVSNNSEGSVEVGWSDLSVFGNTLSTGHGYVHDNYVHDLVPFITKNGNYEHTDTVISEGGDTAGLRIEHNTLLNPVKVDQGASSAIGLYADSGPVTDATISDNWLAGGAYTLYGGGADAARIVVTGNVFSDEFWPNCGYYGPAAYWNAGGSGNVWSGNVYRDGKPVVAPAK